jgi:riboflavin transporter FmnP
MSEIRTGEIEAVRSEWVKLLIQLAGGAIFGALSAVVAFVLSPIINVSKISALWGMALFDPTSWIWIISFLIFGPIAGLVSSAVGSFGLFLIDINPIGPVFKFTATIPLIIVPTLILKLWKKNTSNSNRLRDPKKYALTGVISIVTRIVVMLVFNIIYLIVLYGGLDLPFVIAVVLIINTYTSVLDLIVPYLLVYTTRIDEKFDFW